jgi:myo-inositol 2-dehydrogenase/D-chiro-inositol 1-dehydrogenase
MVRLGFIGTGGRAIGEMLELIRLEDAALAAFCDIAPEKCAQALDAVNRALAEAGRPPLAVPFFTDPRAMLQSVELEGVYVSLPPFAHGPAEHAVLDARRGLLVEKPVVLDPGLGREIWAHARDAGVVTSVGYQLRYSDTVRRARELLAGRTVGMAIATRFGGVPEAPWWRQQARSGGMLVEMHTHAVDLLRHLCGEVETAYAQADTRLLTDVPGLDIADVHAATLRFASGAVGVVANSCALVGGLRLPGAGGTHILAKGLTLTLGGREPAAHVEGGRSEPLPGDGGADRRLNEAFVHALATGDRSRILCDYGDGLRTFEVTWACHRSAAEGRAVRIADL